MRLTLYQVDAFAERVFEGNPAAVCPLREWLDDQLLQAIAAENNLSETAFFVPVENAFALRWFTPVEEVDLCGHATLAAAHVLYTHLGYRQPVVNFETRSGPLRVSRSEHGLCMDFPAAPLEVIDPPPELLAGLGQAPDAVLAGFDVVAVYRTEEEIRALTPDFAQLNRLGLRGVVVTAPGKDVDFVSRCFFPRLGVNEDPVTGSAHCQLAPYWRDRLGRSVLTASQRSKRGGRLTCEVRGDRVWLTGKSVDYMVAEIQIAD